MKRLMAVTVLVGATSLGVLAAAELGKGAVVVDSAKAAYKEVIPGVSRAVLRGDPDKGEYAAFTRFAPGTTNTLHMHTNDIRVVVLQGAYIYQPEKGPERRVAAGQFIFIPGGDRHISRGDPRDGALFYEEGAGRFDIHFIKQTASR
ncbi:MAG: cupin domain-containing protein [Myxococcota bacterium]